MRFENLYLPILFVMLWVKNAYGLKLALQLRSAVKTNSLIKCPAEIIWAFGSPPTHLGTKYVRVTLLFDEKRISSNMICVCSSKLKKGDKVTVIFPESNPKIFAFSKQQIKDAVLTYGVFTVVFAFLSIIYILAFFKN